MKSITEDTVALRAQSVSKTYSAGSGSNTKLIPAVSNLSFQVKRGSFTGLVGKNGCGKSTLLKMIAGIVKPSAGQIEIYGNILAITEVGAGFHPELTGIDNIYMIGKLYGLNRKDVEALLPQITAFSEIADFLNVPVKNYSQGMFLRLAFSIMIHLPLDIVLLDEVLAVGDAAFRNKCFNRIKALSERGLTIIMVSHTFDEIAALCDRCLVMGHGEIIADGKPDDVYNTYMESINPAPVAATAGNQSGQFNVVVPGYVNVLSVSVETQDNPGEELSFSKPLAVKIVWEKLVEDCSVCHQVHISDTMGRPIITASNTYGKSVAEAERDNRGKKGVFEDYCIIPAYLLNFGTYNLRLSVTVYQSINEYFTALDTAEPFPFFIHNYNHDKEKDVYWTHTPAPIRTPMQWISRPK